MTTMFMQQTSFIQSLIEQLWHSKPHYHTTISDNNNKNNTPLSNLPVELINLIITHVDTSTLFKLCRVNRLLRAHALPRLIDHAQKVTMRLWIHQHPVVSHTPLDFTFTSCDLENNRMVFEPCRDTLPLQTSLPPPQIDGCTILIKVNNTRRIYSISYKDRIVPVPLDQTLTGHQQSEENNTFSDVQDAYGCGWQLAYTIQKDDPTSAIQYLRPQSFTCDTDLLDPQVLIASSREKVVVSLPPAPEQQPNNTASKDSHDENDEKKKMFMMKQQENVPSSTWLNRTVNDTMSLFYQWLSSA